MREGSSRPGIAALRARLAGGDDAREAELARAGESRPNVFDDRLAEALRHFQERNGILDDGVLGPRTRAELNRSVEDRIADLELNLDRWRWLPRQLGERYIVVNVAGFELEMDEHDRPVERMRVVVGKTGWNTPVFADTMRYLIVNPYWNVPESITEEEVAPKVMSDPGYLQRNRFQVLRGDRVVDPGSVDWTRPATFRVRQQPGPDNALGRLKFMFPNDRNIYFHDTPADHLFSRTERAFSHGCIRLEKPKELARALLPRVAGRSASAVDSLLATDKEQWVRFDRGVPVYILYFTAWADEDGTVRFYPDVYGRDRVLELQRRQVAGLSGKGLRAPA